MRKLNYSLFLLSLLAIGASSCNKDEDTEKPVIVAAALEETFVAAGDELHLDLQFTDNEGLKEYKIDIHDDFDGHSHGKTATNEKFETVIINPISGLAFTDHLHIDVPANTTAGPYHLGIYVLDEEGNQSDQVTYTFYIANNDMANINASNLSTTAENDVAAGSNLTLQGTITAGSGSIEEIVIVIEEDHEGHGKTSGEIFQWDQDFATPVASWNFDDLGPIAIPASATGHFILAISAKDVEGNIAVKHYELHID